jgi:N-acetylglucosamine-6-sulfatase
MQDRLYAMMTELGGMEIPLNPPRGRQQNKRLRDRNGVKAGDFPKALIVDEPIRKELK